MNQLKFSILAVTFSILTAASILLSVGSASASEEKQSYIAPSVGFVTGGTLYGVTAKFGVADNVAIRPFIQFNSSSTNSLTVYGSSVTYNFNIPRSELIPYLGVGYAGGNATGTSSITGGFYGELGTDYNVSENVSLNANYKTGSSGFFNLGVGYRF
jgi:Outer membrane protein beta-barrel domain